MTNNLWRCLLHCLESADPDSRTFAKRYVRDTAHYLHTNNVNLLHSLFDDGPMPADVEPEVDALIDISLLSASQRLNLVGLLNKARELCESPEVKSVKTSDADEHEFVGRILSCSDAMKKLSRHLIAMRTDLSGESQPRQLYHSLWPTGNLPAILGYILKHPESMQWRTTEAVIYLAQTATSRESGAIRHDWRDVPALLESIKGELEKSPRNFRWYETFIPQRDGWALALGDHLDGITDEERESWTKLLETASAADTSKPSRKFLKAVVGFQKDVRESFFTQAFAEVESAMKMPAPIEIGDSKKGSRERSMYSESSTLILRGIIRMAARFPSSANLATLDGIMSVCFDKIVGVGPRSEVLGQESLNAIALMNIAAKIGCLEKAVNAFKKNKNVKKRISKALEQAQANPSV